MDNLPIIAAVPTPAFYVVSGDSSLQMPAAQMRVVVIGKNLQIHFFNFKKVGQKLK